MIVALAFSLHISCMICFKVSDFMQGNQNNFSSEHQSTQAWGPTLFSDSFFDALARSLRYRKRSADKAIDFSTRAWRE